MARLNRFPMQSPLPMKQPAPPMPPMQSGVQTRCVLRAKSFIKATAICGFSGYRATGWNIAHGPDRAAIGGMFMAIMAAKSSNYGFRAWAKQHYGKGLNRAYG